MTSVRNKIATAVATNPGIHFNELVRSLDLAPGQVQYHLRRLAEDDRLVDESTYGRTHYYPPDFDEWERSALALTRRETSRDVMLYLLGNGWARPTDVADEVGIARSTLEYHLNRLVEADLVEKRRQNNHKVILVATRPETTAKLLQEVHPSLPATMTDRFERLVDNLLDG